MTGQGGTSIETTAAAGGAIVTADGCRLAYRFDGPEDAPVLLLSNSLGTHMAMWDRQLAAFSSRFRVLRYDSRGHGGSDAPRGGYSMDRLGRDVIELLDALQLERVHFCGLSLGGMVGQWLGIRAPERMRRMVLANTAAFMGPPSAWDDRIHLVLSDGMAPIAHASAQRWFTAEFQGSDAAAVAEVQAMLLATDPAGYAGCCAAIRDMDMRRMVRLIERPVLVIGGAFDPATSPDQCRSLAQSISGAQFALLEAAHLSNVEQPSGFAAASIDFLIAGQAAP